MARSREENREYMRTYRASQRGEGQGATVTKLRRSDDSVESAVRDELETLPAATQRPADAAIALAMARILDDPESVPQQAAAAARLMAVLEPLRKDGAARGKSKLTILQERRAAREDGAAHLDSSPPGADPGDVPGF